MCGSVRGFEIDRKHILTKYIELWWSIILNSGALYMSYNLHTPQWVCRNINRKHRVEITIHETPGLSATEQSSLKTWQENRLEF